MNQALLATQLINSMASMGIPVSPFMHYWNLFELVHYFRAHAPSQPQIQPTQEPS